MTAPPAGALEACLALLEKATPGEVAVYDANEGDGWPPRPLWCFKNEAYDSDSEDEQPLQGSVHYGGKEDADAIVAAVNLLKDHGPALLAALRLRERAERLEAALRPFAALYQPDALCAHSDDQPDSRGVYGINAANITLGDLRRARAALADGEAVSA